MWPNDASRLTLIPQYPKEQTKVWVLFLDLFSESFRIQAKSHIPTIESIKKGKETLFLFFLQMKDKRNREKRRKILVSVSGLIQPLANKYTVIFRELL